MSTPTSTPTQHVEQQIRTLVRMVAADESQFGVLSTGEKIAVALVLDRKDLLDRCGWASMLAAVDRLGMVWIAAALRVQREGWT